MERKVKLCFHLHIGTESLPHCHRSSKNWERSMEKLIQRSCSWKIWEEFKNGKSQGKHPIGGFLLSDYFVKPVLQFLMKWAVNLRFLISVVELDLLLVDEKRKVFLDGSHEHPAMSYYTITEIRCQICLLCLISYFTILVLLLFITCLDNWLPLSLSLSLQI